MTGGRCTDKSPQDGDAPALEDRPHTRAQPLVGLLAERGGTRVLVVGDNRLPGIDPVRGHASARQRRGDDARREKLAGCGDDIERARRDLAQHRQCPDDVGELIELRVNLRPQPLQRGSAYEFLRSCDVAVPNQPRSGERLFQMASHRQMPPRQGARR